MSSRSRWSCTRLCLSRCGGCGLLPLLHSVHICTSCTARQQLRALLPSCHTGSHAGFHLLWHAQVRESLLEDKDKMGIVFAGEVAPAKIQQGQSHAQALEDESEAVMK